MTLIRLARAADAVAIATIYAPYVSDSRISFEQTPPDAAEMARRLAGEYPGLHPWLVAEEAGSAIGYAASAPLRVRPAYRWSVENGLYLAGQAQGRGIGRALLSALLDLLERQGYVTAVGAIALPNRASVALHKALGFERAGAYRGIGYKLGAWVDVELWQKDLAPRRDDQPEPLPFAELVAAE
jgi:phosphinothricin acetyltransferase